ncbi:hypothetical protein [Nisaea sp.]|uniref:hypothetical protein n=1 Tax=Nisaea sp. TaxID=2024842 RepID=UPI0032EFAB07
MSDVVDPPSLDNPFDDSGILNWTIKFNQFLISVGIDSFGIKGTHYLIRCAARSHLSPQKIKLCVPLIRVTADLLSADAVVPQDANNAAGAAGAATTGPQAAPQMLSYTARIEIEREHLNVNGRDVRLVPGMSVTADLLTGERRVLEYN